MKNKYSPRYQQLPTELKGMTRHHPLYTKWLNMRDRCRNPKNPKYPRYGGRGITVCKRWESFKKFYEDMNPSYQVEMTIDRIDNNKGYSPNNCEWTTRQKNNTNTARAIFVTYKGEKRLLKTWCDELSLQYDIMRHRINHGWAIEEAFSTPKLLNYSHKHNKLIK